MVTIDRQPPDPGARLTLSVENLTFIRLLQKPGTHRIPEADDFTLRALTENLSLMAVDPVVLSIEHSDLFDFYSVKVTNRLLGVSVNGQVSRESFNTDSDRVS